MLSIPYYVYLLFKDTDTGKLSKGQGVRDTYVGLTHNVEERMLEHQAGKCKATKGYRWKLVAYAECNDIVEARQLEKWLKIGSTRQKRMCFANRLGRKMGNEEGSRFFIRQAKRYFLFKSLKQQARTRGLTNLSFKGVNIE